MAATTRYRPPSASRLVAHWLGEPGLVRAVRELPAPVLGKLIDAIGLESAGELVALATTSQLERVFDEDLWHADAAGEDPRFNPARFALWLEVLLEAGEEAVVARLTELPEDFVILCVERLVLVVDIDRLGVELAEDEEALELTEKALDSSLCEEWQEFRLIARNHRAWDSVLAALLALDREHHDLLRRILERCCAASSEYIDDNGGLYEVLSSEEMLEADARAARDDRRAARGYVAPSDAKSFLALARQGLGEATERDPVTRAYLRELDRSEDGRAVPTGPTRGRRAPTRPAARPSSRELARLLTELAGAEVGGALADQTANPATALAPAHRNTLLASALARLAETNAAAHVERLEELGYLANVLVAGEPNGERRFRPIEALETAASVCNAALEAELGVAAAGDPLRLDRAVELVTERHLDQLFRAGWRVRQA